VRRATSAFTLVELILVMVILALMAALAAPVLSHSIRQRNLDHEASRFYALVEYGRDEARSQGVPMILWVDPQAAHYGLEPQAGYPGSDERNRDYEINPDVQLTLTNAAGGQAGRVNAVTLLADGSLDPSSAESVKLTDRFNNTLTLARTRDNWGYEIVKEAAR
jgi:type II secretion system protein H